MRLTIEPTQPLDQFSPPKVIYEVEPDHLDMIGMVDAFKAVCLAWGFAEESVEEALGLKEEE